MYPDTAKQVADLLNSENQLVLHYTEEKVLASADHYVYEASEENKVIAFVECKKVQWYQFEVCHLTVNPGFRGKRYGKRILEKAINHAKSNRGRIVQCTIRDDNEASARLLEKSGFQKVSKFFYPYSGNNVDVWQKVIITAT